MMKIRIDLEIPDAEIEKLVHLAIVYGYKRIDPQRAWRYLEKLEAARYGASRLIQQEMERRP